ncbi:MAG TPA: NAD(P)/FAD-dependent oxidoreductase [Desulfuromonadaceae bacterium]|jgi:geranylgeranyl reductase family protein
METCDVLVIGGGPAGSTCAGRLVQAGLDVLLMDKQTFPRQKTCAGWITPAVLEVLQIDPEEYRKERVLQDISNFRVGLMYGSETVISYGKTVSYGIRRNEFDHYLLQRSPLRLSLGEAATVLESNSDGWIVNGRIRARLLVGAGGHSCPVARILGAKIGTEPVIVAQTAEFAMSRDQERICHTAADTPALFFCRDMKGYGWLFRKGEFLNVGLGRMDTVNLGYHTKDFCSFLKQRGDLAAGFSNRFQGHAYRLYGQQLGRSCVGDRALLVGDAAGLAYPQSGEGILPAVESALMAADTILAAKDDYRQDKLQAYAAGLASRLGGKSIALPSSHLSSELLRFLGARFLSSRWFVRHVVLDSWFLHAEH